MRGGYTVAVTVGYDRYALSGNQQRTSEGR